MDRQFNITEPHVTATRMPDPVQSALEQAFVQEGIAQIRRCVVPLFAADPNSLNRSGLIHVVQADPLAKFGTGTLIQKGRCRFLITAAHVYPGWQNEGFEVRIGVKDRPRPLAPGIEQIVNDPDLDVSVIRLNSQAAECLAADQSYLRDSVVSMDDHLVDGRYLILGYLAHRCHFSEDRQSLRLQNFSLWTHRSPGPSGAPQEFGYLEYPIRPTFEEHLLGHAPAFPTLGGLSGASVWRIWREGEEMLNDWDATTLRVVGVQVSESDDRTWIKCTLWKSIMPLVDKLLN